MIATGIVNVTAAGGSGGWCFTSIAVVTANNDSKCQQPQPVWKSTALSLSVSRMGDF